ncbi:MAG: putative transcriptional regulatory protein [Candidatus Dojkabacteria bacterium]|nr:MAG: putative transcriptional regulatory protein [Candidatus Dojkabacteria bacterium]
MSGHSKWSTIKRKKAANDAAKAKMFTKVAQMITVAAQNGGGDPDSNPSLALAIEKAKSINMPNDNIQRAINRGLGNTSGGTKIEEVTYEAYGPHNVAILIDCITDNKNRTLSEVRHAVEKHGGRFTESGAVSWQFRTIGNILIRFEASTQDQNEDKQTWKDRNTNNKIRLKRENAEEFILNLLDHEGLIDVIADEIGLQIKTEYPKLHNIKKLIESLGYEIYEAGLIKESTTPITIDPQHYNDVEKFIETIEELDEVQNIWTNCIQP